MVDDSELDYIRTFLGKVHTAATAMQIEEAGNLALINDTQRMLVFPGEILSVSSTRITKRYLVKVSETGEATLTTAINNIQIGILKANRRQTITAWTKPASWCTIRFANSNKQFYNLKTKRWDCDIYLDIEWSIE
jgi:c-di-AMP phosphodiesterase-like protein